MQAWNPTSAVTANCRVVTYWNRDGVPREMLARDVWKEFGNRYRRFGPKLGPEKSFLFQKSMEQISASFKFPPVSIRRHLFLRKGHV